MVFKSSRDRNPINQENDVTNTNSNLMHLGMDGYVYGWGKRVYKENRISLHSEVRGFIYY